LTHIFNRNVERKRNSDAESGAGHGGVDGELRRYFALRCRRGGGVDGRAYACGSWMRKALARGKSVVTANKQLIAYVGQASRNLLRCTTFIWCMVRLLLVVFL